MRPNKINVMGSIYKIRYCKDRKSVKEQQVLLGYVDNEAQIISVALDVSPEEVLDTLLHEMAHVIFTTLKIDVTERDVSLLAMAWSDTLVRNKLIDVDLLK